MLIGLLHIIHGWIWHICVLTGLLNILHRENTAYMCAYGVITPITSGKYGICVCLQCYYTYYIGEIWHNYMCAYTGLLRMLHGEELI